MANHQSLQQQQQQAQVQIASSAQVLLSSLLEMPLADFEERLQNELMDNEALEVNEHEESSWEMEGESSEPRETDPIGDALSDYRTLDDVPENIREAYNQQGEEGRGERQISDEETSYEDLYRQIGELQLTEEEADEMT